MRRPALVLCAVACSALASGCAPSFDRRASNVDGPRVLAVRSEPAEARPSTMVALSALTFGLPAALDWGFCVAARPASEYDTVSARCAAGDPGALQAIAAPAAALVPSTACALFGSEPLPPMPNEMPTRPADPDASGGYYQPVRVAADQGTLAFGDVRIQCALARAPVAVVDEFRQRYVLNTNPTVRALSADRQTVAAGEAVTISADWDDADAEPYVVFDPAAGALVDRVETLRVSWFATAGAFAADVTETRTVSWAAPASAASVQIWAVLRDDRGGVGWQAMTLEVR